MKYQLDPNSSKPLHVQAEEMLRELIRDEEYKKGKLLPNEVDLSKELNISRNTLRQAINKLVFEGLLIRKKGYGTTVAPLNVMSNARNWKSFSQEMKAQGTPICSALKGSGESQACRSCISFHISIHRFQ